jgi:hypothetical protein
MNIVTGRNVASNCIWLMKQQSVVAHTLRQTHILTSLHSPVTNTPSVKMLCPQTIVFSYTSVKNITCLSVGPLRICPVPSVCCQTVYPCVTTYCCCIVDTRSDLCRTSDPVLKILGHCDQQRLTFCLCGSLLAPESAEGAGSIWILCRRR